MHVVLHLDDIIFLILLGLVIIFAGFIEIRALWNKIVDKLKGSDFNETNNN